MIVITACLIAERIWIPRHPNTHYVRTKMGEEAGTSLDRLLRRIDPPQAIVGTGFCGGLSPDLHTGTTVVAERIIQENKEIAIDPLLIEGALRALDSAEVPYAVGTIVTTARIAKSEDEKNILADKGAIAVDMESGALARVAHNHDIPFLPLRVVLDEQRDSLPFSHSRPFVRQVLAHPYTTSHVFRSAVVAGQAIGRAVSAIVDTPELWSRQCVAQ